MQPHDLGLQTPQGRPLLAWRPFLEPPELHAETMLGDRGAHMRELQVPGYPRAMWLGACAPEGAGPSGSSKGPGFAPVPSPARAALLSCGCSMVDDAGDSEALGDTLLGFPLPSPRVRIRPWWFPAQDLRNPLVFFLEAWLADSIFGVRPWA